MNCKYFCHSRTPSLEDLQSNEEYDAWKKRCQTGLPVWDLSVSNPTVVGLPVVQIEESSVMKALEAKYQASPQGLEKTRKAIAQFYRDETGAEVDCDKIQLFASTSEAIGALMKLMCAPGDEVITFTPTYPLLDCLTSLEHVHLKEVPLQDCAGEWCLDFWVLENAVTDKTRAIIVVSPNNPTGHRIRKEEFSKLCAFCAQHEIMLVVDEVFGSYLFRPSSEYVSQPAAIYAENALVVSLSGLSKVCGLPQHKLGWAVFGGPEELVSEAMARMQFITDSTLSVSGWVQHLTADFLHKRADFVRPCMERMQHNLETLRDFTAHESTLWTWMKPDGGWSVCIRLPGWSRDEAASTYLAHHGIRVFPGAFFGFRENQPTLVVSLLPEESVFRQGLEQLSIKISEFLNL